MKTLLIDNQTHISLKSTQLTEAKTSAENNGYKGLLLKDVILQEKDSMNQNGRVYPGPVLEREVNNYIKTFIDNKSAFGVLDHPDSPIISAKEISHIISKCYWDGNTLKGDINIIDTPNGKIAQSILEAGGRLGVSSRSLGSVKEMKNEETGDSQTVVQDDLELLCWDIVSNPSVLRATFRLNEGLEYNEKVLEKHKRIQFYITKILEN